MTNRTGVGHKILQWNISNFNSNKDTLITLIRDHNIQIIALNETSSIKTLI